MASLGVWQLQRLAWKEGILAEINNRIGDDPISLPTNPDPVSDRFLPVRVSGQTTGEDLLALVSVKHVGPGYRIVSAFELDNGRRVLLDEGFISSVRKSEARKPVRFKVTGNLHWPDEVDGFTPEPDLENGVIFARDVDLMSEELLTEPVLIIAREMLGDEVRASPLPVTSDGIPNNHFGYAVQWFGLALVWAGMTAFYLWRKRH